MLSKVTFKFGSSDGENALGLEPSPMVVFVGPNNSGKSLVLRELLGAIKAGQPIQDSKIISSIDTSTLSQEAALTLINGRKDEAQTRLRPPDQLVLSSYHPVTGESNYQAINLEEALSFLCNENPEYRQHGFRYIYSHYAVSLDGQTRLLILDARSAAGQLQNPTHVLGRIFVDDETRQKIRTIGERAFGKFFVIDPTSMANLEVRLSDRAPVDSLEEHALDGRAREFHARAQPLAAASDGVKAYLGLTAAVLCSDHKLMLIDEPEAFLHPPLASSLGKELAQIAANRESKVFISTHSEHFLMGAIESGAGIDIVRLTYNGEHGTARVLRAVDLSLMMRDPLLRSTGMLSALFHSAAIICEGDLDRAAYSEVSRRLEEVGREFCKDSVFLSAHGKDSIHRMIAPLRRLGIPAAAVVDLDMIQEGLLGELLKSCGLPEGVWQGKRDIAARVAESCRVAGVKLKDVGVMGAPGDVREALIILIEELRHWGLFLVPVGELERWLVQLNLVASTKRGWLFKFFEKAGNDPNDANYLRPADADIWEFVEAIARWIQNPVHGLPR